MQHTLRRFSYFQITDENFMTNLAAEILISVKLYGMYVMLMQKTSIRRDPSHGY